ncbi:MAG: Dna2/Cas4 domain-containing protein, partial [Thermoplasmata archaeon]|nr:Dna2/Cas4 domain-containing protein [Thermoplasmata archaeon]
MTIKIDSQEKIITLSVKDLAGGQSGGGLFDAGPSSRARASAGRAVHENHQAESKTRLKTYRHEVFLKHELDVDEYHVIIRGRLDGVYERRGTKVVEEIKSVISISDIESELAEGHFEKHMRQVQLYIYLLAGQTKSKVTGYLVFVELLTGVKKRVKVSCIEKQVAQFIADRIREIIGIEKERGVSYARQARAAAKLLFPFPVVRKYQDDMMGEIAQALSDETDIMLSAPAGVGKTVAALYPALEFALKNRLRLFFVTSKTTQQNIVMDTLRRFGTSGANVTAVRLRAKAKICPNDICFCHPD